MKRQTITERFLDECPNCGAAREGDEDECGFCGTSLVERIRVEESESDDAGLVISDVRYGSHEKADIVSKVKPGFLRSACGTTILMFAVMLFALAGISYAKYREDKAEYDERVEQRDQTLVNYGFRIADSKIYIEEAKESMDKSKEKAVICLILGVVSLTAAFVPVIRYRIVCRKGKEYDAVVVSNTMALYPADGINRRVPTANLTVKVRAWIDGRDTTVSLPLPYDRSVKEFPTGRQLKIRVLGKNAVFSRT